MDFNYTEEQISLQDTLRKFVQKDYTQEKRRALLKSDEGFSREAWKTYAELGLLALSFPEDVGGLGGNAIDTMIAVQALAPGLVLEPYIPTVVLAGSLVNAIGTQAQREKIVGAIAEGGLLLSLAHHEPNSRYALSNIATTATKDGTGWTLNGHKAVVLGGASADQLIVSARTSGNPGDTQGVTLFIVEADEENIDGQEYPLFDGTRARGVRVRFGDAWEEIAAREVVLCSGAIHSPCILMRSGIGPAAALRVSWRMSSWMRAWSAGRAGSASRTARVRAFWAALQPATSSESPSSSQR